MVKLLADASIYIYTFYSTLCKYFYSFNLYKVIITYYLRLLIDLTSKHV